LSDWFHLEKVYYDFAPDIEAVSIHFIWTPIGEHPDWEHERYTRLMPLVYAPAGLAVPPAPLRRKMLKLPRRLADPATGELTAKYLLHHYFEVVQSGHRRFSPLYTEEVDTETGTCLPYLQVADGSESAEGFDDTTGNQVADAKLVGERERQ
jgi:hypothetical protein